MSLCLSLSLSLSKSGSFKVFVDSLAHSAHLHFDLASMSNLHVKLTTFMSFAFVFYFYFAILEWLVRFFVRARRFGMTRKCTGRREGCGGSRARQGQKSPDKCEYMHEMLINAHAASGSTLGGCTVHYYCFIHTHIYIINHDIPHNRAFFAVSPYLFEVINLSLLTNES